MLIKTQRTLENEYGLANYDGNLLDKPCILGYVPEFEQNKAYNGFLNLFMYLLQIRKKDSVDSDYDISDVPFDLISRVKDEELDEVISEAIPENNITEAKRIMRKLNIISYCNGNFDTGISLKRLHNKLLNKGYSSDEVKQILRQVFVLQIVDNYVDDYHDERTERNEIPYATVVTVHDVFDLENADYYAEEQEHTLFTENPFIYLKQQNNSDRYVLYRSFGEGSLCDREEEHLFSDDYAKAPIINYIMSLYLIKALHMSIVGAEITDSFSLQTEIEQITVKALEFINGKEKNYNKFSRQDLRELNDFLMSDIQGIFKKNIPVRVLSPEEKASLDKKEDVVKSFYKTYPAFGSRNYILRKIREEVDHIYYLYDNFADEDIADEIFENSGAIRKLRKVEAIKLHINQLASFYTGLMGSIKRVIIPADKIGNEITTYLQSIIDRANAAVSENKLQQIVAEYGDQEQIGSLRV